jgi:hypothetical protein
VQNITEINRIVEILCAYRQQTLSTDDVDVVPDLQIVHLFAARVAGVSDYLVHTDDGAVEEVTFETWPPRRPRPPQRSSAAKRKGRAQGSIESARGSTRDSGRDAG